ncbi:SMC-Scp complex subunit ScpB [Candidatus Woesearchaeota archaeon]|nr:SMC-Scp complex subunit ScpB [Candidatus Woesearchaeota archaeon]
MDEQVSEPKVQNTSQQKTSSQLPLLLRIEALLFAAARYVTIEELSGHTNASPSEIKAAIEELKKQLVNSNTSLNLLDQQTAVKLNVKDDYLPVVHKIIQTIEFEKPLMQTLAVIAWKYPALQADIIRIRHNKAYDHLMRLEELGFINRTRYGRTKKINLTQKFFEYFDLPSRKQAQQAFRESLPDEIKNQVEQTEKQIEETEKVIEEATRLKQLQDEEKKKEEQEVERVVKEPLEVYTADSTENPQQPAQQETQDAQLKEKLSNESQTSGQSSQSTKPSKFKVEDELGRTVELEEYDEQEEGNKNAEEKSGAESQELQDTDSPRQIFSDTNFSQETADTTAEEESSQDEHKTKSAEPIIKISDEEVDKKVNALLSSTGDIGLLHHEDLSEEWGSSETKVPKASSDEEEPDDEEEKAEKAEYSDIDEDSGEEDLEELPEEEKEKESD